MAAVTILRPDVSNGPYDWQLLKPLQTAQTAVTAANLTTPLLEVAFNEAFYVIPVESYLTIQVQTYCIGANDETAVLELYGWSHSGPGHHMGTMGVILGNFTTAASTGFHASSTNKCSQAIRDVYAAGTAYRGADTFSITAQYGVNALGGETAATGQLGIQLQGTMEANFPANFHVNFESRAYKYFGISAPTVPATSGQVGLIYRPTRFRTAAGGWK